MSKVSKETREALEQVLPLSSVLEVVVREELRDFVISQGMASLTNILEEERTALCGAAYGREGKSARRAGSSPGTLVLGGRKVSVSRPRVRDDFGEVMLESYRHFSQTDALADRALEQMVVGVSTRRYERSLEDVPEELGSSSTSKSAVSRRFVAATQKQLSDYLRAPIDDKDIECVMLDGIHFGDHVVVIALGIDSAGKKHVLGFWEGSTENAAVCTSLLNNLIERGLSSQSSMLFVIDGGKGLRSAIRNIFGERALVQRCQIHKIKNVLGHLPKSMQPSTRQAMREAYDSKSHDTAKRKLKSLAHGLSDEHPGASASLLEGLDETITIKKMELSKNLELSLATTNAIESLNSTIRHQTRRVKRWKNGKMILRWVTSAVIEAEKKFRSVRGYRGMPKLVAYLRSHDKSLEAGLDEGKIAA